MDVAIALGGGAASGGTLPIVTGFSWLLWIEDSAGGGGKARRRKRGHALKKEKSGHRMRRLAQWRTVRRGSQLQPLRSVEIKFSGAARRRISGCRCRRAFASAPSPS